MKNQHQLMMGKDSHAAAQETTTPEPKRRKHHKLGNLQQDPPAPMMPAKPEPVSAIQKQNYASQPDPIRPQTLFVPAASQGGGEKPGELKEPTVDPSKILKQMSQQQIAQLLQDPEISRILKETMQQQEESQTQEQIATSQQPGGATVINLDEIMPLDENHGMPLPALNSADLQLMFDQSVNMLEKDSGLSHGAHQVDPNDPRILGNEFEVPQEKTLNTEDFAFTGLPEKYNQAAKKPKLYVGPPEGFFQEATHADAESIGDPLQVDHEKVYSIPTEVGSGQINFENLQEQSESSSDPSDTDLALQLYDGEEMNFMGIHRMQSINSPPSAPAPDAANQDLSGNLNQERHQQEHQMPFSVRSDELHLIFGSGGDDDEEQQQYFCPVTGAHFHKADLYQRILRLKKRRALIDRAIEEEEKLRKRSQQQKLVEKIQTNKELLSNQKQERKGGGASGVKATGRNMKVVQLGHGRQILTDGNEKSGNRKREMSNGSSHNKEKEVSATQDLVEDAQAVILKAGKFKYNSNGSRQKAFSQYSSGMNAEAVGNKSHISKFSNQISSNSEVSKDLIGLQKAHGKKQNDAPSSSNQTHVRNRSQGRAGAFFSQQPQAQVNQAGQPPHERMLQFASGQYTVESHRSNHIKDLSLSQERSRHVRQQSSQAGEKLSVKPHRVAGQKQASQQIQDKSIPSAYHSHDSRRSQKPQVQKPKGSIYEQAYYGAGAGAQAAAVVAERKGAAPVGMRQVTAQSNKVTNAAVAGGNHFKELKNNGGVQKMVLPQHHQKLSSQHTITGGVHRKGESASFDMRKPPGTGPTDLMDFQRQSSIDASEAQLAYRSVQDQRNFIHQQNIQMQSQYRSQGSNQAQQSQQSQLVGVKSSQIEGGSRVLSKISIQKAKMRQKQIVSAVIQNAKSNVVVSDEAAQKECVSQSHTFDSANRNLKAVNSTQVGASQGVVDLGGGGSGNTTNALSAGRQSKNLQLSQANVVFKKLMVQKAGQNQQHQAVDTNRQIEQVEQFYAMLSGHQVVFNRPGVNATGQPRGTNKDKTRVAANGGGTHARTNTFDNRATVQSTNKQLMTKVLQQPSSSSTQRPIQLQPSSTKLSKSRPAGQKQGTNLKIDKAPVTLKSNSSNQQNTVTANTRYRARSKTGATAAGLHSSTLSVDQQSMPQQQLRPTTTTTTVPNATKKHSQQMSKSKSKSKSINSGGGRNHQQKTGGTSVSNAQQLSQMAKQNKMMKQFIIAQASQAQKQNQQALNQRPSQMKYVAVELPGGGGVAQQQIVHSPQASSQQAFASNQQHERNLALASLRNVGGGPPQTGNSLQTHLVTDQSLRQQQKSQGQSQAHSQGHSQGHSHGRPKEGNQSYNSVPLKPHQAIPSQHQVHKSVTQDQMQQLLYRIETDQASDTDKSSFVLENAAFDENGASGEPLSAKQKMEKDEAKAQQQLFVKSAFLQKQQKQKNDVPQVQPRNHAVGGTPSTKHRKSNSLGYKVVIGSQRASMQLQPQTQQSGTTQRDKRAAGDKQSTGTNIGLGDTAMAALFKTFNDSRVNNSNATMGEGLAVKQGSSGQQQKVKKQVGGGNSGQAKQQLSMGAAIGAKGQHRRNQSMYYQPSANANQPGQLFVDSSTAQQHQTQQAAGSQHKKSHSNASNYIAQSVSQVQPTSGGHKRQKTNTSMKSSIKFH